MIKTSCKDCVFAIYNDGRQTDCYAGRLEKFPEKSLQDDTYFIIDRFCNLCRDGSWGEVNPGTLDEQLAIARRDAQITVDAIIYHDQTHTLNDLKSTINSLVNNTILPRRIVISLADIKVKPSEVRMFLNGKGLQHWNIDRLLVRMTRDEAIKHASRLCKSTYCTTAESGFVYPTNFIEALNKMINSEMRQIVIVEPHNSINGYICNTKLIGKDLTEAKKEYKQCCTTFQELV